MYILTAELRTERSLPLFGLVPLSCILSPFFIFYLTRPRCIAQTSLELTQ